MMLASCADAATGARHKKAPTKIGRRGRRIAGPQRGGRPGRPLKERPEYPFQVSARHVERDLRVLADEGLERGLEVQRVRGSLGDRRGEVALAEGEAVQRELLRLGELVPDRLAVEPRHLEREEQPVAERRGVEGLGRREEVFAQLIDVAIAHEAQAARELEGRGRLRHRGPPRFGRPSLPPQRGSLA